MILRKAARRRKMDKLRKIIRKIDEQTLTDEEQRKFSEIISQVNESHKHGRPTGAEYR